MYSNTEILTAVIVTWAKPMVDEIVANRLGNLQPVATASEWVKKYFPVPNNYSIVNDISFLAVPASEMMVGNFVRQGLEKLNVSDKDVPAYAARIVDSLIEQADKKGCVSLFNTVEIEKSDLEKLRYLLRKNLPVEETAKYEVIE
jgi:hypothetical protein